MAGRIVIYSGEIGPFTKFSWIFLDYRKHPWYIQTDVTWRKRTSQWAPAIHKTAASKKTNECITFPVTLNHRSVEYVVHVDLRLFMIEFIHRRSDVTPRSPPITIVVVSFLIRFRRNNARTKKKHWGISHRPAMDQRLPYAFNAGVARFILTAENVMWRCFTSGDVPLMVIDESL